MDEQSKASQRRQGDWRYANRWLVGRGIDVGCGPDPLKAADWPLMTEIVPYDVVYGHLDGKFLSEIENESFNFVHSSHCLEHLTHPQVAIHNWLRVLKPGGFIICTVPDEYLYELGRWPSRFNPDHKASFSLRHDPVLASSTNLVTLLNKMNVDVEMLQLLTEHWDFTKIPADQTLGPAECAIEFVVRKPEL